MLSNPLRTYLQSNVKVLYVIWIAFQVAAALYYLIARVMGQNWPPEDRVEIGYAPVFYICAALLAVPSFLYQRRAFSEAKLSGSLTVEPNPNSLTTVAQARNDAYAALGEADRSLVKSFAYVQTSYIVTWAQQEAIAILGLMLAILTRDTTNTVLFNLVAIALLFVTRPTPLPLLERATKRLQYGGGDD
ncbi:hypothetical protein KKA85_12320 [bacterium]|nr:hypothetical protein [bacterium]